MPLPALPPELDPLVVLSLIYPFMTPIVLFLKSCFIPVQMIYLSLQTAAAAPAFGAGIAAFMTGLARILFLIILVIVLLLLLLVVWSTGTLMVIVGVVIGSNRKTK